MAENRAPAVNPAATISERARVLAQQWGDLGAERRVRLLAELDAAAERLSLALSEGEFRRELPPDDLDEVLAVRCSSF